MLGWADATKTPRFRDADVPHVAFEFREGNGRGFWEVWIDGQNETMRVPDPKPAGWMQQSRYQLPNVFRQRDGEYAIRITGVPQGDETVLRFYFQHMDRPIAVHSVEHDLYAAPVVALTSLGGQEDGSNSAAFSVRVSSIDPIAASTPPQPWQTVLQALDLNRPELRAVADAIRDGDLQTARQAFLSHMRTRKTPRGPSLESFGNHPNYRTIADNVSLGRYARVGWFDDFDAVWTDAAGQTHHWILPDGTINWGRDNGHLNRHFHWIALALAAQNTSNPKYAKRFAMEVKDWVTREPFLWPRNPEIGKLNWMDGTVFQLGYMNTSNIGRRCELTWWYAYEAFRGANEFDDEAHFAMLLGFLRQSRLMMNPTSFAAHDDGGAHISTALLQNALMLPEFSEATRWKEVALEQWDEVLRVQFLPDGSHVSLSTGYNWASINALQNLLALLKRTGEGIAQRYVDALERSYRHPMLLARSDRGQIDLNDGGWGKIADHMQRALKIFPERRDFEWFATDGESGEPPQDTSVYFPNAGHFVLRTGWSPDDRYLFFDAGPVGASHGKEDKLSIYVAIGEHQLISSGGRGAYSGGPFSAYTGSTRGYNTVLVDDGVQSRFPQRKEIMSDEASAREFQSTLAFDLARGSYVHGWHHTNGHTQGEHQRTVVLVKGDNPPVTSYYVVFDRLSFPDDKKHRAKALFHLRRNLAGILDEKTKIVHGWDTAASVRIMPARPDAVEVEIIRAQTNPHVQGWHVVGTAKAPMNTPTFHWQAAGTDTQAWVVVPAGPDQKWCVKSVSSRWIDGELAVLCKTANNKTDIVSRAGCSRQE